MAGKPTVEEVRRQQILKAAWEVAAEGGLARLTVRTVAARADVSHALVLFYFQRKDGLLLALLEWLIASSSVLRLSESALRLPGALNRLHALLQQEMRRVVLEPEQTRLFFEYWAMGARHPAVRERIGEELERYRTAFRTIIAELVSAEPEAFSGTSVAALAAVAVSWIQGCAVQMMTDPEGFDSEAYMGAVGAIVRHAALADGKQ